MGLKLKLGFSAGGGGGPIRDTRVLSLKSAFPSSPPKEKDLDNPNKRHQDCIAINAHSKTSVHKLLELVEFKPKEVISREATLLIFMVGVPNVANAGEDEACYCRPTPGVTQDIAGYKIELGNEEFYGNGLEDHLLFYGEPHSRLQREFGDLMQGDRNHVEISCKISRWVSRNGKYAPVIARMGVHVECICTPQNSVIIQHNSQNFDDDAELLAPLLSQNGSHTDSDAGDPSSSSSP